MTVSAMYPGTFDPITLGHEDLVRRALTLFERGQALARRCESLLDKADLKVQQLLGKDLVDFDPQK